MAIRVCVVVLRGFSDSSVAITLDAFAIANRVNRELLGRPEPFAVSLASIDGRAVHGRSGLRVQPALALARVRAPEVVVVPGMGMSTPAEIDATLARSDVAQVCSWLGRRARTIIASSCSGVFLLAAAGLLERRAATTTWWLAGELARRFPTIDVDANRMVVESGNVITAGASLAQLDLVLRLVARLSGPELADLVSRYLVADARTSQARYAVAHHLSYDSAVVRRAEQWIRSHLTGPLRIAEIASAVGTTHRTLARRVHEATGLSPLGFVQHLRVESARNLLAATSLSVDEISSRVGYESSVTLRRVLAKHVGASPRELRRPALT